MTLAQHAVTTTPLSTSHIQSRRCAVIVACALAAVLTVHAAAEAAPVTFGFETRTDAGDLFGIGLFTFDDTLFPFPYKVISGFAPFPPGPDVFLDFFYIDPHVGFLGKPDVASVHFEIALDPFTQDFDPVNSKWAFIIADVGNFHVLQGDVSGLGPQGGTNTFSMVLKDPPDPQDPYDEILLAASFPQRVPEPASLLLLGTAVAGFVARRRVWRG